MLDNNMSSAGGSSFLTTAAVFLRSSAVVLEAVIYSAVPQACVDHTDFRQGRISIAIAYRRNCHQSESRSWHSRYLCRLRADIWGFSLLVRG